MATVTATDFLVATGTPGLWVRLHNNVSGTDYYSTAVSDPQGAFTYTVPTGEYSLYVGSAATVPGTPTLRNGHFQVAVRNGDDAALNSGTFQSTGPYNANLLGATSIPTPAGVVSGKVWDYGGFGWNAKAFNAKFDGQVIADGAMTSGAAILTSASGKFVSTDAGKLCVVQNAGNAGGTIPLATTILSYQSPTQVTLATVALANAVAQEVFWSTDDLAAIQATFDFASSSATVGSKVQLPHGAAGLSGTLHNRTGVFAEGEGAVITGALYDLINAGGYGVDFPLTTGQTPIGTRLVYCGPGNGTIVDAIGIRNWGMDKMDLDGQYYAGIGMDVQSAMHGRCPILNIERVTGTLAIGLRLGVSADSVHRNCVDNRWGELGIWWVGTGVQFLGGATGTARVTLNKIDTCFIFCILATGAGFRCTQYCDSNWIDWAIVFMENNSATQYAVIVNDSATPNAEVGAGGCLFNELNFQAGSTVNNNIGVLINVSQLTKFNIGFSVIKNGNDLSVPTPTTTSYVWNYLQQTNQIRASYPGPIEAAGVSGQSSATFQWRWAGTLDMAFQREAANAYVLRALTPNKKAMVVDQATGNVQLGDAGVTETMNGQLILLGVLTGNPSFQVNNIAGSQVNFQVADNGDTNYRGHLFSTAVGTPATSNLGANVTSATFTGNDTRGEVAIVMSAGLAANTRVCTVTFAVSYGATAPKIILVDQTSTAGLAIVNSYVLATSTGVSFDLAFDQALVAGTYKIDYIVIG